MKDAELVYALLNHEIEPDTICDKLAVCEFRKKIYRILHKEISARHGDLVRTLLDIEISEREKNEYDEDVTAEETYDFEAFYWCIFLLSRIGDVHDVFIIWYAKNIDFDSAFGVDWKFLTGAGFAETIDFLEKNQDEISLEILSYLSKGDVEDTEQENLKRWYDFRYHYYMN